VAIDSGSIGSATALKNALVEFGTQILELIPLREWTAEAIGRDNLRVTYQCTYSHGVSIGEQHLATLVQTMPKQIFIGDCRNWEPDGSFDVVVTDPPYGSIRTRANNC
jgi:hypothetical protein